MSKSEKPNLLMLTSSFPAGPEDETCGYIRDFARSLAPEFNVTVLAPPDENACEWPADDFALIRSKSLLPGSFDPFQAGYDFNRLLSRSIGVKIASVISLACYFRAAMQLAARSDVVCSHWLAPSGLIGAIISRVLRKPHVVVEHSGALHLLARMRGGRAIARLIASGSHRIIAVSEDLKNKLVALCPDAQAKIEVIPMGIAEAAWDSGTGRMNSCGCVPDLIHHRDTEYTKVAQSNKQPLCNLCALCVSVVKHPRDHIYSIKSLFGQNNSCSFPSQGKRTVLFIGRLTEVKGVDVLLRAVKGIDGLRVIIAGDGDLRCELEKQAQKLSVDAVFTGRVGAAGRDELLAQSDVVVIPSRVLQSRRTEGMPVVCLEAMAAGRVVIASRTGGLAEIIADGHNGLLFDEGNDRMLAEKIARVMADEELRQKLTANARQTVLAYHWPHIAARYSRVIKDSLNNDGSITHDKRYATRSAG